MLTSQRRRMSPARSAGLRRLSFNNFAQDIVRCVPGASPGNASNAMRRSAHDRICWMGVTREDI